MSEVQEFFKKNVIPLVGHRKPSNDAKRYIKRPLIVVYYGVDFSFDYKIGMFISQPEGFEAIECRQGEPNVRVSLGSYTILEIQGAGGGQGLP